LISFVWDDASIGLFGVLETQLWELVGRKFDGVGVLNWTSSLDITLSGSKGIRPAP
jgi:hypothetical protein